MKTALRGRENWVVAGVVLIATVAIWLAKGSHPGWTRDLEFRESVDPVTELPVFEPVEVWVPGVDFIATGALVSLIAFAGTTPLARRRRRKLRLR